MDTSFKVLSHACLLVNRGSTSIIIDPWLIGSCYWRSWWNFPEASIDEASLDKVKYVIISHVHWDHWHGPTVKKYFKDKIFIIPNEPSGRSYTDLKNIGIKNIHRLRHGDTITLDDGIDVTLYQFGLHLVDAAIVVETPEAKLLNANDAKIAGQPLRNIINRHGRFDFAFRSHSSANPRVCFTQKDQPEMAYDDDMHYARSFQLFMDALQPTFAVPFASNHCHLHKDTYKFNKLVTNPVKLRDQLNAMGALKASALKIMLPGSGWSSASGFSMVNEDIFLNVEEHLARYQEKVSATLEAYYRKEEEVNITEALFNRYFTLLDQVPRWRKSRFKEFKAVYEMAYPSGRVESYLVQPYKRQVRAASGQDLAESAITMRFPAIVFRDSVLRNMFEHALISKRCAFSASDSSAMAQLRGFLGLHSKLELGVYPISLSYLKNWLSGYAPRWREVLVYGSAAWHMFIRKRPIYLAEEEILKKT